MYPECLHSSLPPSLLYLLTNPQEKANFVFLSLNDGTVQQYVLPPFYRQNMKVERDCELLQDVAFVHDYVISLTGIYT